MDAWRVEVATKSGLPDPGGAAAEAALRAAGLEGFGGVRSKRGYLLGAELTRGEVERFAGEVLADAVAEEWEVLAPGEGREWERMRLVVMPLAGVTDPVAGSVRKALGDSGMREVAAGTYRVWEMGRRVDGGALARAAEKGLANVVVQQVLLDCAPEGLPGAGREAQGVVQSVTVRGLGRQELVALSREGGLALDEKEMLAVQREYEGMGREPTRLELETIAQTWSEHCKHKTLTGRIDWQGEVVDNLLKNSIGSVTRELARDWCLSVFVDNAGVVAFDDEDAVCIKVETHNHPSAIEPFGGAGTGVGGVIRDVLGTGLAARPVASLDVFCLAPVDMREQDVPKGCLHPLRVLRGVVAGVRDYGNPMGIPTVNGAIHFDPDFVGNPLVYVGTVGLLPRNKVHKQPRAGDRIVAVGGRTGRDGIHGATFSSLELHTESETLSSGAVQIGDPITERKVMDLVLRARDEELFSAITDCGAGGFSSAVGEMAEGLGADVELGEVPLKYAGLEPWEIWISEAQERMVLAVPDARLPRLLELCREEEVTATVLGTFDDSGRLVVRHQGVVHGELDLEFLHGGLPRFERRATWQPRDLRDPVLPPVRDLRAALLAVLADPNVASKEWVIRQYDHEVQAGSAAKPLVGVRRDGPADAAVLAPKLGSHAGIVLATGLNPRYSRIDPAAMAECALDEALRNIVAAGGDPDRTAVLDNYCWGNTGNPERLGELVRATFALCDLARTYRTPFVSGKDSLNNEFRTEGRTIAIPGCILVTALSVIPDVRRSMTSDFKRPGSKIYLVGLTRRELGGSVHWKLAGELGASVPRVDAELGHKVLQSVAAVIASGAVRAAHDLSEGGLGAALAEMAIGGRLGADCDLACVPLVGLEDPAEILFSESQSRFLLEVDPARAAAVEARLRDVPHHCIGEVTPSTELRVRMGKTQLLTVPVEQLAATWRAPLALDAAPGGVA